MKIINIVSRYALSILFLISAISKIGTMDQFGLFIYDLTNTSFDGAGLIARALIGIELLLAFLFLYPQFGKTASLLGAVITLGFSIFLAQHLELKNCFCFGANFPFSAKSSLWKNAAILAVIALYYFSISFNKKGSSMTIPKLVAQISIPLLFALPFIINVPNIFSRLVQLKNNQLATYKIQDHFYKDSITAVLGQFNIASSGTYLVPIISSECKYCKASMAALKSFGKKYNFKDKTEILIIGDSTITENFMKDILNNEYEYHYLDVLQFMKISKGIIPQFLFIKNGSFYILKSSDLQDGIFKEWLSIAA